MSAFTKTSPLSTSYGTYGAANVNPYSSYFGAQPHHPTSPAYSSPPPGAGHPGYYSPHYNQQPQSSSFASPSGSLTFNPHSFGAATSPFTSPGQHPSIGGGQHFVPLPAQTRIIGGIHTGPSGSGSFHQSPHRYYSSGYNTHPVTPGRGEDFGTEPMHYSPIHTSPHGHNIGVHNNSPTNNVILPSYLLGMDQHPNYPHSIPYRSTTSPVPPSPGGGANQSVGANASGVIAPSSFMNPPSGSGGSYRRSLFFEPTGMPDSDNDGAGLDGRGSNLKGPPIHGFGSSEGSTTKDFMDSPWMKDSYNNAKSPCTETSPAASQSKYHQPPTTPATAASTWVTVFGFPAGASSFILSNFSTYGKIMEVKATHGSNWLHIRYSNKIEARCALSKNGKVLGGSIMVGVVNSDPKVVKDAESTENTGGGDSSQHATTNPSSSILRDRNSDSDVIKSRIRPLATGVLPQQSVTSKANPKSLSQMPSLAREAIEVDRNASGSGLLPSASSGVFTKAMEFMFGW